jgi:hypothetical protein
MTQPTSPGTLQFCTLLQPHITEIVDIIHQHNNSGYLWQYTLECMGLAGGISAAIRIAESIFTRRKFTDQEYDIFIGMLDSFSIHMESFET